MAAQKLRKAIHCVNHDIDIAIVIEIAEGAPASRRGRGNAQTGNFRDIFESAISQVSIEQLALCISRFGLQLFNLQPSLSKSKNPQPQPRYWVCAPSPAANVVSSKSAPPRLW